MAQRYRNIVVLGLSAVLPWSFAVAQEAAADRCALEALELHAAPDLVPLLAAMAQEPAEATLTVDLDEVDARTAFEIIAKAGDGNLVLTPGVRGKVSVSLRDVPWREAVARVAEIVGARVVPFATPSGAEVLRVEPEMLTRSYRIAEAALCAAVRLWLDEAPDVLDSKLPSQSAQPEPSTGPDPSRAPGEATVEAVNGLLSKDGTQRFDESTCSFVIRDIRESLDAIAALLRERDVLPSHSPQSNPSAEASLPAEGNGAAGGAPDLNR